METIYEIAKWSEVFETAESRRHKSLSWVSFPIKTSSSGYQSMLDEFGDDAAAIYGAWCALVAFAAQQSPRGRLCNSQGKPVSFTVLVRFSGFPQSLFERLLDWAKRDEVRWLVPVDCNENTTKTSESDSAQPLPSHCPGDTQPTTGLPDQTRPDKTLPYQTLPDQTLQAGSGFFDDVVLDEYESVFDLLTPSDLANTRKLKAWMELVSRHPKPVIGNSEESFFWMIAAAECAIESGDDPMKLFKHKIGRQNWKYITQQQQDRADKRIKDMHPKRINGFHFGDRIAGLH
jgi:hypothetical protein